MKIAILGAGAWGSSLAASLSREHSVRLWSRNGAHLERIRSTRESAYLPGIRIPDAVGIDSDGMRAVGASELAIIATSTAGLEQTAASLREPLRRCGVLWACKGFEPGSARLPHEVIAASLEGHVHVGALSGPSFAQEVARGLPAALTVASRDAPFAAATAASLNGAPLRIYSSTDVLGVELGGALKNVMAIAAGISDGLGLGANARAALITRGLAEMARLGVRMGGDPETFMGLTGLGDLVLTATGDLSRNRTVGLRIAKGVALERILAELGHVAEGVSSARAARSLAERHQVEMPITSAVCAVLFEGLTAMQAVQGLLAREAKPE